MPLRIVSTLLGLLLSSASTAHTAWMDGAELMETSAELRRGYVGGCLDANGEFGRLIAEKRICVPAAGMTLEAATAAVLRHLRKNANQRSVEGCLVVIGALVEAWYCEFSD